MSEVNDHTVDSMLFLIANIRADIYKNISFFSSFESYDREKWEPLLEELDELEAELQILMFDQEKESDG